MLRRELGRGLAFPLRLDRRGCLAFVEGQEDVEQSIRIILGTRLGERLMRSLFGSIVPQLLFEPATPATGERIVHGIRAALTRWEPRIDLLEVSVARDPEIETRMVASLSYRLRANNAIYNQVYPFYLKEGVEEL